jgi:hypothetical protein
MDVKIITNFGVWTGGSGKGNLYVGVTPGGTYFACFFAMDGATQKLYYLRRSQVQTGLDVGDMQIAGNFRLDLITDAIEPDFTTANAGGYRLITGATNEDDLPRLFNLEPAYTIKGEGIVTADIDKIRVSGADVAAPGTTTPTTTNNGALGGLIPNDFSKLFSNPIAFAQENYLFVAAVLGLIWYVRRKQKKVFWIF